MARLVAGVWWLVPVGGDGTRKHGDRCRTSLFKHRGQGNK